MAPSNHNTGITRKEVEDVARLAALETASPLHEKVNNIATDVATIAEGMNRVTDQIDRGDKDINNLGKRVKEAETHIMEHASWIQTLKIRWRVMVGTILAIGGTIGVLGSIFDLWKKMFSK